MDIHSKIRRRRHVRIITVGNVEAGKTSIIRRYCEGRFSSKYQPTVGVDYGTTRVSIDGIEVMANIFDLSGHPVFKIVRMEFYSNIDAVLLVYDISNSSNTEHSESLERWLHEMAEGMDNTSVVCVVCRNKSLLLQVLRVQDTGRDPVALWSSCNYSKEELQAVHQVRWSRSEYEKLGVDSKASRDDINRSYRRLAVLLHPDKSTAPGCEEAFKMLVAARTALLKRLLH
ncbi:dnaJ homolog subfamily C member 27-like isoform X2 [Dermacentor albipictus]|uniref:dnaJ homolog subfamily C member 27-like isoform X2 n=1 Tax=Dermacentor albipictus TaxID=60249 RepID=UPI0031FBD73B